MTDLVNLSVSDAAVIGVLGYAVVFLGLVLLMFVVMLLGKVMVGNSKKKAAAAVSASPSSAPVAEAPAAPPAAGTAGDVKLYNTDPRDAAMLMAITADSLGKPLNELRFKSIRKVEEK